MKKTLLTYYISLLCVLLTNATLFEMYTSTSTIHDAKKQNLLLHIPLEVLIKEVLVLPNKLDEYVFFFSDLQSKKKELAALSCSCKDLRTMLKSYIFLLFVKEEPIENFFYIDAYDTAHAYSFLPQSLYSLYYPFYYSKKIQNQLNAKTVFSASALEETTPFFTFTITTSYHAEVTLAFFIKPYPQLIESASITINTSLKELYQYTSFINIKNWTLAYIIAYKKLNTYVHTPEHEVCHTILRNEFDKRKLVFANEKTTKNFFRFLTLFLRSKNPIFLLLILKERWTYKSTYKDVSLYTLLSDTTTVLQKKAHDLAVVLIGRYYTFKNEERLFPNDNSDLNSAAYYTTQYFEKNKCSDVFKKTITPFLEKEIEEYLNLRKNDQDEQIRKKWPDNPIFTGAPKTFIDTIPITFFPYLKKELPQIEVHLSMGTQNVTYSDTAWNDTHKERVKDIKRLLILTCPHLGNSNCAHCIKKRFFQPMQWIIDHKYIILVSTIFSLLSLIIFRTFYINAITLHT